MAGCEALEGPAAPGGDRRGPAVAICEFPEDPAAPGGDRREPPMAGCEAQEPSLSNRRAKLCRLDLSLGPARRHRMSLAAAARKDLVTAGPERGPSLVHQARTVVPSRRSCARLVLRSSFPGHPVLRRKTHCKKCQRMPYRLTCAIHQHCSIREPSSPCNVVKYNVTLS